MPASGAQRTFCFDLDGTLCTNTHGDYDQAQPFPWAVERVNALAAAGHRIIVFTARGSTTGVDWRELTEGQLRAWGVRFDELRLGKPGADVYVDDRAMHTDAWQVSHSITPPAPLRDPAEAAAGTFVEMPWLPPPRNTTVVEVARTFGGRPRLLDRHVDALMERADTARVPVVLRRDELVEAAEAAASSEPALLPAGDDLVITLALSGFAHAAYLDAHESPDTGLTVGCRLLSQAAQGLLRFGGPGGIAATTDPRASGWPLRELSDGTLFDALGGSLVTFAGGELVAARGSGPNVALGELAEVAGMPVRDGGVGRAELEAADESFVVGFPFCVIPLLSLDGRPLPRGGHSARLLEGWSARANVDLRAQLG